VMVCVPAEQDQSSAATAPSDAVRIISLFIFVSPVLGCEW
jgi:hypothetical protein